MPRKEEKIYLMPLFMKNMLRHLGITQQDLSNDAHTFLFTQLAIIYGRLLDACKAATHDFAPQNPHIREIAGYMNKQSQNGRLQLNVWDEARELEKQLKKQRRILQEDIDKLKEANELFFTDYHTGFEVETIKRFLNEKEEILADRKETDRKLKLFAAVINDKVSEDPRYLSRLKRSCNGGQEICETFFGYRRKKGDQRRSLIVGKENLLLDSIREMTEKDFELRLYWLCLDLQEEWIVLPEEIDENEEDRITDCHFKVVEYVKKNFPKEVNMLAQSELFQIIDAVEQNVIEICRKDHATLGGDVYFQLFIARIGERMRALEELGAEGKDE